MSKENLDAPDEFDEDAAELIELIDDDGNELKFKILDVIKYKGEKYALLLAAEPDEEFTENDVVIFRLNEAEEALEPVEDDKLLDEVDLSSYDLLVVPGGSVGVDHLAACAPLADELRRRMAADELVGAICAGPTILANLGLLEGREAVCYPGCEDAFPAGAYQAGSDVAVDGNLITATGPGIALVFGVALLNALAGAEATARVARDMLLVK